MSFLRSLAAIPFAAALAAPACSGASTTSGSDACTALDACCAGMPAADVQACSQQSAAARAQSDSESVCNALLSSYRASGFCTGGSSNSNGSGSSGSGGSGSGGSGSGGSGSGGSGGSSGNTGSSGGGSGGVVDGASLQVNSVTAPGTVNGATAPSGTFYVVVDFTLQNVGAASPLSTTSILFSVDTSQALVVAASSNQPSGPCGAGISVAPGGHIQCQLAFTVPDGQTPATLAYDDLHGDKATAPLPSLPAPSGACDTVLSWFSKTPSSACVQCVQSASGSTGTCSKMTSAYTSACTTCTNTCNTSANMCTCERGCDSTSCQALYDAAMQCIESACSPTCP